MKIFYEKKYYQEFRRGILWWYRRFSSEEKFHSAGMHRRRAEHRTPWSRTPVYTFIKHVPMNAYKFGDSRMRFVGRDSAEKRGRWRCRKEREGAFGSILELCPWSWMKREASLGRDTTKTNEMGNGDEAFVCRGQRRGRRWISRAGRRNFLDYQNLSIRAQCWVVVATECNPLSIVEHKQLFKSHCHFFVRYIFGHWTIQWQHRQKVQ